MMEHRIRRTQSKSVAPVRFISLALALVLIFGAGVTGLRSQEMQGQPAQFGPVIAQADRQLYAGNYKNAAERYFFATKLAKTPQEFSRAYFGLSLSYFYLKDIPQCEKYVRLVLEVDPKKSVSAVYYPISFVQIFDRIRNDLSLPAPTGPAEPPQVEVPAEEPKPQPPTAQLPPPQEEPPPTATQQPPQAARPPEVKVAVRPGGHFEFGVHVSSWGIDLVKDIFESELNERVGKTIRNEIAKHLRESIATYDQELSLDSSGSNYGAELRYYTKGWAGSYSLGLSFEKTHFELAIMGSIRNNFKDGTYAIAEAQGFVLADLYTYNMNFRWEITPWARVSPYFIFGLGIGSFPLNGELQYSYSGTFYAAGRQEAFEDSDSQTIEEAATENEIDLPDALVMIHVGFGLRVKIIEGLMLQGEAGIWDGFMLRAGVAYRF